MHGRKVHVMRLSIVVASLPLAAALWAPASARALPPVISFTSPTTIDEGTGATVSVVVTDPEGSPVTWSWDTDFDGAFGELAGETTLSIDGATTDGPSTIRVGVQASDGTESRTVYRTITVDNVSPTIASHPTTAAALRTEYRYEVESTDPAGPNDPLEHVLASGPPGMVVAENVLTWTPTTEQRGRTYPVVLRVTDGDGGDAAQSWSIT